MGTEPTRSRQDRAPFARKLLPIALLLGVTTVLYVQGLSHAPPYLGGDEAHFGVHAYAIAQDGRNLDGTFMPLFVNLWDPLGDQSPKELKRRWYQPMLFYLTALELKFLPLNEVTVRLPIALVAGLLCPLLMYAVAFRILKSRRDAVLAALLLALSPSYLILGRQALDYVLPLPFVLGWLWCLVVFLEGGRLWLAFLGGLLLGVGFYSYIAAWVFMPLCVGLGGLACFRTRRADWIRACLVSGAGFALPLLPILPWLLAHPEMLRDTLGRYQAPAGQQATLLQTRPLLNYLAFFDPWFLFATGGPVPTTSLGRAGVFLLPVAALLPIGLVELVKRGWSSGIGLVLLGGLLLSPLPATFVGEPQMIQRGLFILPFAILISGLGFARLWQSPARLVRAATLVVLAMVPVQFGYVYRDYLTHYKLRSAFYYDAIAFKDVAEFVIGATASNQVPAIYLNGQLDDVGSKWRFYTIKHGRQDLLHRTRYFDGDGVDLRDVRPGSILVMYMAATPLKALLDTKQWSVVKEVYDVDNRASAIILRRVDAKS